MVPDRDSSRAPANSHHPPEVMTPYAATRLVNKALAAAGIKHPKTGRTKEVQPTMLYVYASQGRFRRFRAADGRWTIDRESFNDWLQGYVDRMLERQVHREELDEKTSSVA